MAADRETPLARWSRLKQTKTAEARAERDVDSSTGSAPTEAPSALTPAPTASDAANPSPEDCALPDPETLGADADFTAYLKAGVPDALKRRALRVLWRSDPVLANLDGLNDYDDDYSAIGIAKEVVETAYRAGRGYLSDEEDVDDTFENAAEDLVEDSTKDIETKTSENTENGEIQPSDATVDEPSKKRAEKEADSDEGANKT